MIPVGTSASSSKDERSGGDPEYSVSNEHLTLYVEYGEEDGFGTATLETSEGYDLLYTTRDHDAWSSYLTVQIDGENYANYQQFPKLNDHVTQYPTVTDNAIITEWTVSSIVIEQTIELVGEAAKWTLSIVNTGAVSKEVKVRYLFDYQVRDQDGAPIVIPEGPILKKETKYVGMEIDFDSWFTRDYVDSTYTVQGVHTLSTKPSMIIFANWAWAEDYEFDYPEFDPDRAFYTPGEIYSPDSDSCALLYWDLTNVNPGETKKIVTYYGIAAPPSGVERLREMLGTQRDLLIIKLQRHSEQLATIHSVAYLNLNETYRLQVINWFGNITGETEVLPEIRLMNKHLENIISSEEARMHYEFLKEMFGSVSSNQTMNQIRESFLQYILGTASGQRNYLNFGGLVGVSGVINNVTLEYNAAIQSIPNTLPEDFPIDEVSQLIEKQNNAIRKSFTSLSDIVTLDPLTLAPSVASIKALDDFEELLDHLVFNQTQVLSAYSIQTGMEHSPLEPVTTSMVLIMTVPIMVTAISSIWMSYGPAISSSMSATVTPLVARANEQFRVMIEQAAQAEAIKKIMEIPQKAKKIADFIGKLHELYEYLKKENDKKGQINDVNTPNITGESLNGTQTGTITLRNTGSEPVTPYVYANIIGPLINNTHPRIAQTWPKTQVTLMPGEMKTIDFTYSVPLPEVFGQCFTYVAQVRALFGAFQEDFFTSTFIACSPDAQEVTESIQAQNIMTGEIGTGESLEIFFTTQENTQQAEFLLNYPGSDFDLHVYDQNGRHVGLNYSTGEIDLEIPGAIYSGHRTIPESVMIRDDTTNKEFRIIVIGVDVVGSEKLTVTAIETQSLPPLIHVFPPNIEVRLYPAHTIKMRLTVTEYGGQSELSNVLLQATDLSYDGKEIAKSNVQFSDNNFNVKAGSSVFVTIDVSVPYDTPGGIYMGKIVAIAEGNLSDESALIINIPDIVPPETNLTTGFPRYDQNGNVYVNAATEFTLNATDEGFGVDYTSFKIDDESWMNYSSPFNLSGHSEGQHTIYYSSTDKAGNVETIKNTSVILDNTSPTTNLTIGKPEYITDTVYVSPDTPFTLEANDTGSGVNLIAYRIYNATYDSGWLTYTGLFNFTSLSDGNYTIAYNSTDNVDNVETANTLSIILDNTSPKTTHSPSEGTYSETITITLNATDGGSGINETYYKIGQGGWTKYTGPFSVTEPGDYTIYYYSVDYLGNLEKTKFVTYKIARGFLLWLWLFVAGLGLASSLMGYLYLRARKQLKKNRQ